ncbi:MAG: GDSL-type esterase/lipase family protein [Oscillospiraceae bacterium]|nr:GDSL-type esterase/lipase family protein [Oscillospiraceae bacterium]
MKLKKNIMMIIAVLCCFSCIACAKDGNTASTENIKPPTQNSSKSKVQITDTTSLTSEKKIVESASPVSPEYFDDVVFVGDSISEGLRKYVAYEKETSGIDYFGNAKYLTAVNFGIYNALIGNSLPVYKGQKKPIEDNIAQMDVKKVYILLGMNDLYIDTDTFIKNYQELINRILAKKPGLDIIIQSITPITRLEESKTLNGEPSCLNRANVGAANKALKKMAEENNYYFLNVRSVLTDAEGYLPNNYSVDGTCHMVPKAFDIWIHYLQTHTLE